MQFILFTDIDECASVECPSELHECLNTLGSYICVCTSGYNEISSGHCEGGHVKLVVYNFVYDWPIGMMKLK